ncbi:hypothetical protein D3C73_726340 [compost metagenome]
MRVRIEVRGDGEVQPHVLAHVLRVLDLVFRPRLLGDLCQYVSDLVNASVVIQRIAMVLVQPARGLNDRNPNLAEQLSAQGEFHVLVGIDMQFQDGGSVSGRHVRGGEMQRCLLAEHHLVELSVVHMLAHEIGVATSPFHGEVCSR